MKQQLEFKKNKRGQWFWHFRAKNGRIVADSAESYSSKAKARQGFRSLAKSICAFPYSVFQPPPEK